MKVKHEFCLGRDGTLEQMEYRVNEFLRRNKIISILPYCHKDIRYERDELGYLIVYDDDIPERSDNAS